MKVPICMFLSNIMENMRIFCKTPLCFIWTIDRNLLFLTNIKDVHILNNTCLNNRNLKKKRAIFFNAFQYYHEKTLAHQYVNEPYIFMKMELYKDHLLSQIHNKSFFYFIVSSMIILHNLTVCQMQERKNIF